MRLIELIFPKLRKTRLAHEAREKSDAANATRAKYAIKLSQLEDDAAEIEELKKMLPDLPAERRRELARRLEEVSRELRAERLRLKREMRAAERIGRDYAEKHAEYLWET